MSAATGSTPDPARGAALARMAARRALPSVDALALAAVCALFVAMGWPFVLGMGIEVDEALAGAGLYPGMPAFFSLHIGERAIPLMVLSYLGALKVWICAPLFALFGPNEITLRLPSLLLGAASIVFFWLLLRSAFGRRTAWVGSLLFATDTSFLLLTAIDFGPVAMQLALKTCCLWLFARWKRSGKIAPFAAASFLAGAALWDKAIFMWVAAGMAAGAAAAFPSDVRRALRPATLRVGVAALCLGALPLIVYNVARPLDTFRSNARLAPSSIPSKLFFLRGTLDGSLLRGFFTAADAPPITGQPEDAFESAVVALNDRVQLPSRNWSIWTFALAVVAIPFLWRTPARAPAVFGTVSFVVGWLAMSATAGAGAAAHHVALLWPLQFLVVAVVLEQLFRGSGAWVAVVLAAALVAVNLGVTCRYYDDLIRKGPAIRWTRAVNGLEQYLEEARPQRVFAADWNIWESLTLLSKGSLRVLPAVDFTAPGSGPIAGSAKWMARPGTLFVGHAAGYEQIPGASATLDGFAQRAGFQRIAVKTIRDSYGRPIFEVFQFR